jgi:hypothetical protein
MHVKVAWDGSKMQAIFGRGLIFCYLRVSDPSVGLTLVFQGQLTVWAQSEQYLGVSGIRLIVINQFH